MVPIGIAGNVALTNYETLRSLIKKYPLVPHLRLLIHSLNVWSLDWQPSRLFLENLFHFQKIFLHPFCATPPSLAHP